MANKWSPKRWDTQRRIGLEKVERLTQRGEGCWIWTGNVNLKGYGYIRFMGKPWLAHRLVYTLDRGPIPDGMALCHHCDTPACVRPDHLFVGSKGDNNRDMGQKRRARGKRRPGELNFQAKLTQRDVEDIRFLYFTESMTQVALAKEFHISQAQVSRIVRMTSWAATE